MGRCFSYNFCYDDYLFLSRAHQPEARTQPEPSTPLLCHPPATRLIALPLGAAMEVGASHNKRTIDRPPTPHFREYHQGHNHTTTTTPPSINAPPPMDGKVGKPKIHSGLMR